MNWVKELKIKKKLMVFLSRRIINLDSNNGPGTHWVCYVDSFNFDPFGLPPPENILFIKRYNTSQYKKKISILCGYFCLLLIKKFQDGNSICNILYNKLDPINPSKTETILKNYFINYGNVLRQKKLLRKHQLFTLTIEE